ncbi:MAG: DUF882 domain-containing protein [Synergistaceae bacterium]|nr:DUF882 domain-containing protein [Synergistaceae bacterium]
MAVDTKNFKVSEFACKHCGKNLIDQRVLNMAQELRDYLGVPVRVNSGYRCETHNKNVGGVKNSKHVQGKAADLSCSLGSAKMFEAVKELRNAGKLQDMDYCIKYKTFIHIDCGGKRKNLYEVRS